MKKFSLYLGLLLFIQINKNFAQQGTLQMKDSYFHRFYYNTVIMGEPAPGKYGMNFISGNNAFAYGLLLDFPNDFMNRLVKYDNISQTAGLLIYMFEDQLIGTEINQEFNSPITGTSMTAFSLSYGWNIYDLPLGLNVYTGLNFYSGSKSLHYGSNNDVKDKFFAPAPYLYMSKPWEFGFLKKATRFMTFLDLMVAQDYRDLAKLAATALLERSDFDVVYTTERNASEYNDTYESSFAIQKKFGSFWFFKNVVGLFASEFRNLNPSDAPELDDLDKIMGGGAGYYKLKAGTAFSVNNLANERFADKIGDTGNYFAKAEFGYILGLGFSYKVAEGFGWKIGLNYTMDLDQLFSSGNAVGSPTGDVRHDKMLSGKKVIVNVDYSRNFINDDVLGLRVDPKMARISLIVR